MSLDGRGRCWGRNSVGALGQGNTIINIGDGAGTAMSGLTDIDFGSGIKISSIHAGSASTCVITTTGGLIALVVIVAGQAGQGHVQHISTGTNSRTISSEGDVNLGGASVSQVAMGGLDAAVRCALNTSGQVKCWGAGSTASMAMVTSQISVRAMNHLLELTMTLVKRWYNFLGVSYNLMDHFCVLTESSRIYCWGYGADGGNLKASTDNIGLNEKRQKPHH